jgi:hypothetical protein
MSESNAESLLREVLQLTTQKKFDEAKPIAFAALESAVREHGAVEGRVDNTTLKCRLALMRCGEKAGEVDKLIGQHRNALKPMA